MSPRKIHPDAVYDVKLCFPLLEEPIDMNIKIVKCVQLSARQINSASLSTGEMWEVRARIVPMSIGLSDKLYHQIRKVECRQIAPAAK